MPPTASQNANPRVNGVPAWHPILEFGPTQPVPDNRHLVRLQAVPGMGAGLVAIADIARGTRILTDTPILCLPPGKVDEEIVEFCKRFQDLSGEDVRKLDYLYASPCLEPALGDRERDKCRDWTAENITDHNGQALRSAELEATVQKTIARWTRYATNCFQLYEKASGQGSGIYPMFSCMNHSCVANTYPTENLSLERLTVYAMRDIKAGEQLTTNYGVKEYSTLKEKDRFLYQWGFICQCEACTSFEYQSKESKAREIFDELRGYGMENIERFPMRKVREGHELLLRLVEACKELRMTLEVKRAYRDLARLSLAGGDMAGAIDFARKELEIEIMSRGTDTEFLRKDLKGAKYWLEYLEAKKKEAKLADSIHRVLSNFAFN